MALTFCQTLLMSITYGEDTVPFRRRKNQGKYCQVLIENDHKPMITHEEYEIVQAMMTQKVNCSNSRIAVVSPSLNWKNIYVAKLVQIFYVMPHKLFIFELKTTLCFVFNSIKKYIEFSYFFILFLHFFILFELFLIQFEMQKKWKTLKYQANIS